MSQDSNKIFQIEAIQENALMSLPCSLANSNSHDSEEDDGPSSLAPKQLTSTEIPTSLNPAKEDNFVKQVIRNQVMSFKSPLRRLIWRHLYLRMEALAGSTTDPFNAVSLAEATAGLYHDTIQTCFGSQELPSEDGTCLPSCIDVNHTNAYFLSSTGKRSVSRILTCFAYNQPDLQFCPMLYSISSILRHFLSEEDTYGFLAIMAASKRSKYLFLSKLQLEVASVTAYELSKKYCRKHILMLEAKGTPEEISGLFNDWIWWIFDYLPFPHVVRVLDTYFVEGYKIFYRVGFALLRTFVKYVKSGNSKWNGIIDSRGIKGAFIYFCREMPVAPDNLVRKGFKIRGFSKANIEKTYLRTEVDLKSRGLLNQGPEPRASGRPVRSNSHNNLPSPESIAKINAASASLTYKELITIWHWLPERMTMGEPELVYSSNEHGISLTTFYHRSEQYEPTILVIKTTEGEVFGAYCSTSWNERNFKDDKGRRQHYFGTGETFLFSFANAGNPVRYIWVNAGKSEDEMGSKVEAHQKELFMCGRTDMVAIGGGNGNGILLDPTLTQGKTERCDTFDNPPLCKSGDFTIAAIEVYGLFKLDLCKGF